MKLVILVGVLVTAALFAIGAYHTIKFLTHSGVPSRKKRKPTK